MSQIPLKLEIDPEDLDIDETELLEDITGQSIPDILAELELGRFKAKLVRALCFIAARRADPNARLEDIGKIKIVRALDAVSGMNKKPRAPQDRPRSKKR